MAKVKALVGIFLIFVILFIKKKYEIDFEKTSLLICVYDANRMFWARPHVQRGLGQLQYSPCQSPR